MSSMYSSAQHAAAAGPRFNYEEYMKGLKDKLQGSAPNANAYIGADFQAYLMREREGFQKSVHQLDKEAPVIQSLYKYQMDSAARGPSKMSGNPYQHSPQGFRNSASVNSLHYMSNGGLSSDGGY